MQLTHHSKPSGQDATTTLPPRASVVFRALRLVPRHLPTVATFGSSIFEVVEATRQYVSFRAESGRTSPLQGAGAGRQGSGRQWLPSAPVGRHNSSRRAWASQDRRTSLSTPKPSRSSARPSRSSLRRCSPRKTPVERSSRFVSTSWPHAPTVPPSACTRAKRKEAHIVASNLSDWRLGLDPVYKLDPQCPREVAT